MSAFYGFIGHFAAPSGEKTTASVQVDIAPDAPYEFANLAESVYLFENEDGASYNWEDDHTDEDLMYNDEYYDSVEDLLLQFPNYFVVRYSNKEIDLADLVTILVVNL